MQLLHKHIPSTNNFEYMITWNERKKKIENNQIKRNEGDTLNQHKINQSNLQSTSSALSFTTFNAHCWYGQSSSTTNIHLLWIRNGAAHKQRQLQSSAEWKSQIQWVIDSSYLIIADEMAFARPLNWWQWTQPRTIRYPGDHPRCTPKSYWQSFDATASL